MNVDLVLAAGVILFAGGLAILTVLAWRRIDRWAVARRLAATAADGERPAEPIATCGVPTFGGERCGLLTGHTDRHLSWPSGRPYPPDEQVDIAAIAEPGTYRDEPPTDEILAVDPPVVPRERLNAVGGWVQVGDKTVHRSCNEDRRDGRFDRVCAVCADRLGMAPTGGTA